MNYCNNNSFLLIGTSLVVQWLRIHAPNAGSLGSLPAQAIRSHMPELKVFHRLQQIVKILHVATKTWCSQINEHKYD